jgi:hypothetical protein
MTPETLLEIVSRVRGRWRLRRFLQGAAVVLGLLLGWVVLGAAVLDTLRFPAAGITAFRVVGYLALAFVAIRFVVMPLLRRASDQQIALYIEEHEPGLEAALLAAVEHAGPQAPPASPALVERIVAQAVARMEAADQGRAIERPRLRRAGRLTAGLAAAGLLAWMFGPGGLRTAGRALLMPWEEAAAATPYAVLVRPGDATVPRGGDLEIGARLRGFSSERVELLFRRGDDPEWQRVPMVPGDSAAEYLFRLFDIADPIHYVVEANGVRSRAYTLTVSDLPAVGNLAVELRYPAFTGMVTERQDPGGDIVAPRGTTARFFVTPTMPSPSGRLITEMGDTVPLRPSAEGILEGALRLTAPGGYRIELQAPGGDFVEASLRYRIELLEDRGPSVFIRKPGRDAQATAVEEVFTEVEAADDYGVGRVELLFRVNGGEEQRLTLHDGGRRQTTVTAGHTFFLEEYGLVPGDVIGYYARARDNGPNGGRTASSDIYFLRIRPFGKEYRQAEQRGMPGQGDTPEGLSERQRQIVAGTFKVERDQTAGSEQQTREDLATLALAQGRLRERVEGLVDEMSRRNAAGMDSIFAVVQKELSDARPEMRAAEEGLGRRAPADALPAEQRALQHLQRAEEAFREVEVSIGGQQGGGGGGSPADAEDLADLFELETDKLRNQYETVERGDTQQQRAELDETLERLKQLASRHQQENERLRRAAEQLQQRAGLDRAGGRAGGQAGGGGGGQSRLAQETEELARRLERLSREQSSPELAEASRRLQEAADAMRRSATGQAGSDAQGSAAAERLREAARSLESGRRGQQQRSISDAARRAAALAEREREIGRDVERALTGGRPAPEAAAGLLERKDSLASDVGGLEQDLDRLSREMRPSKPEAGRRLEEAAGGLREDRVEDKIRFSKGLLRGASPEYARNFEEQIATNLDSAAARIDAASEALAAADSSGSSRALERARQLVRGMESTRERVRQQADGRAGWQEPGGQADGRAGGQQQGGQAGGRADGQPEVADVTSGGRPGGIDPRAARQLTREFRERRLAADSLLVELEREGLDAAELEDVVAELRRLESGRLFDDPTGLERLQSDVLERLKAFEFALRRRTEGESPNRPLVGAADQVPPRFRELVAEYYRSLARSRKP